MELIIYCCKCKKNKIYERVRPGYDLSRILKAHGYRGVKNGYVCPDCQ